MAFRVQALAVASLFLPTVFGADDPNQTIPLTVPAGVPLRLYLTKKVSKHTGAPMQAKVLEPVYAFDREVIPAGVEVHGQVSRAVPVSKWERTRAILAGDFTPLKRARVEFTSLVMPDGRVVPLHTIESLGLNSIVNPNQKPKKAKKTRQTHTQTNNTGVLGMGKQKAQEQINAQIGSRTRGLADIVRGPDKKEKLVDFLMAKLPYHPQSVRRGTRFDAELRDPLQFGSAAIAPDAFTMLGSQPSPDSVVHARLLTALDSASSKQGQAVEAVVMEPIFSPDHKLVLPEGSRLSGSVVLAKKARWFHRGGQLRFNFQRVDLPEDAARLRPATTAPAVFKTQAILGAAESGGKTAVKVDSEGGVKATESKTRLIAPMISILVANKSMDNDAGRHATNGGGADANVSGRTLGGGLGFGMLGSLAAQSSRYVGTAFGVYGMAWSVYSNVIARGGEVEFGKNAMVEIKFGARKPAEAAKFQSEVAGGGN
jgi:hypothetical protein